MTEPHTQFERIERGVNLFWTDLSRVSPRKRFPENRIVRPVKYAIRWCGSAACAQSPGIYVIVDAAFVCFFCEKHVNEGTDVKTDQRNTVKIMQSTTQNRLDKYRLTTVKMFAIRQLEKCEVLNVITHPYLFIYNFTLL